MPANGAAGDARDACQALAGLDTAKWGRKGAAGDIAFNRYAAAGVLSTAAAAGDATYKPLAEAVRMSQIHHRQSFDFDEKTREKLREARRVCEGLW
ncbi:hypothetical protein [Streptomyces sp. NPDC014894]|uniref:hypothetical protein n=1 Tax=unclassified Streptomyces TaxID=2593676 RepID=UPI0036F89C80